MCIPLSYASLQVPYRFLIFFVVYFSRNVSRTKHQGSSGTKRPVPADVHKSGKRAGGSESPHPEGEKEKEEGLWYSEYGQKFQRAVKVTSQSDFFIQGMGESRKRDKGKGPQS